MYGTGGDGRERDRGRLLRCSKTEGGREGETGKGRRDKRGIGRTKKGRVRSDERIKKEGREKWRGE